jgi:hypothetical protein
MPDRHKLDCIGRLGVIEVRGSTAVRSDVSIEMMEVRKRRNGRDTLVQDEFPFVQANENAGWGWLSCTFSGLLVDGIVSMIEKESRSVRKSLRNGSMFGLFAFMFSSLGRFATHVCSFNLLWCRKFK